MRKNEIFDAYEAMKPGEDEKKQLYDRILSAGVRKKRNMRPLAILAASLALLCVTAVPLIGMRMQPGTAVSGSNGQDYVPAILPEDLPVTPDDPQNRFSLRREEAVSLAGVDSISVTGLHQDILITVIDAEDMTIRHYDYDDIEPFEFTTDGPSIAAGISEKSFAGNNRPEANPRFEIGIPRSYRGNADFGSVSGDITVEGGADWERVNIGSVSGDIRIDGLKAVDMRTGSVSGDIFFEHVEADSMNVGSVSGSVTVDGERRRHFLFWGGVLSDLGWPEIELPGFGWPGIDWPDIELPGFDWPGAGLPDLSDYQWPDLQAIQEEVRKDVYDTLQKELRVEWSAIEALEGWEFDLSVVDWAALEWNDDVSFGFAALGIVKEIDKNGLINISHMDVDKDDVVTQWGKDWITILPETQEIKAGDTVIVLFKMSDYFLFEPIQILIAQPK